MCGQRKQPSRCRAIKTADFGGRPVRRNDAHGSVRSRRRLGDPAGRRGALGRCRPPVDSPDKTGGTGCERIRARPCKSGCRSGPAGVVEMVVAAAQPAGGDTAGDGVRYGSPSHVRRERASTWHALSSCRRNSRRSPICSWSIGPSAATASTIGTTCCWSNFSCGRWASRFRSTVCADRQRWTPSGIFRRSGPRATARSARLAAGR